MTGDSVQRSEPLAFFDACLRQAQEGLGRATVAVLGRTGAGKSTLVNGVFGERVAATGSGAPVTGRVVEHRAAGAPLTLLDTPGLELGGAAAGEAADEVAALVEERARRGIDEALHVVWYCVDVEQARLEPAEETLLARCARCVPTIAVLTKSFGPNDEATARLHEHVTGLHLPVEAVIALLAQERVVGGHSVEPFGLQELVAATVSALPEGARRAFVVTQRQALDAKVSEARAIVVRRSLGAGALALRDGRVEATALGRHQLRMLAEVSALFSLELPPAQLRAMIAVVTRGATGLQTVVERLLSMLRDLDVPGVDVGGTLVGAATATASTRLLGDAYTRLCREVATRRLRGEELLDPQLLELFEFMLRRESP